MSTESGTSPSSPLSPFGYRAFTVIWSATVVSNIGTWLQNAAAGWLMMSMDPSPLIVSFVQAATSLPMFLFALPAGALADIVDRRKLLILLQVVATVVVAGLAIAVWAKAVTPILLLAFTFGVGVTSALSSPAWQAINSALVPRAHLPPAIALNGIGMNVSRAVGPPLASIFIAAWGIAAPFCLNAISNIGVIGALAWWRPSNGAAKSQLPPERLRLAMRAGLRHARHNARLRATLYRAGGFFLVASAYWALLPLVARNQVGGSVALYGVLLGAIGAGAIVGGIVLPRLKRSLGPEHIYSVGAAATAVSMILIGLSHEPTLPLLACFIAGMSWISVLATLNVSAQLSLPEWVRARGLAVYGTVMFGGLSLGSILWGKVATVVGLPVAHFAAAGALLLIIPAVHRWKLVSGPEVDLTPSMHWPSPVVTQDVDHDRGPVLVTVEYRIRSSDKTVFRETIAKLEHIRRRDGALMWNVFEDLAEEGRFLETFLIESWLEHLRQHERTTKEDQEHQDRVNKFDVQGKPKVTHFAAA